MEGLLPQPACSVLKFCTELVFMKALFKPATGLFLIYFMMNSLVFFGQDLSVRKHENGAWCISLAEHYQAGWNQAESTSSTLHHSRHSCTHRHQGNEVHICIDHHKFLLSFKTPGIPGEGSLKSRSPVIPGSFNLCGFDQYQHSVTLQGHDPGPALPGFTSSSILLL